MEPVCGLLNSAPAVAGSSRSAWTASWWASQAASGASVGEGPAGSRSSDPEATKSGSHPTRCPTTSRAAQPDTGAAADQSCVPCTRRAKSSAISRCRRAGSAVTNSEGAIGQQPVDRGVPVVDADLHAAAEPAVAGLEAVAQGLRVEAGAPVAEVLEGHRLQGDAVGHALPGEGLDKAVGADGVEAAAERLGVVAGAVGESPGATLAGVPFLDLDAAVGRAHPLLHDLRVGVGPEELLRAAGEVAPDVDHRDRRVRLDGGLVVAGVGRCGHDAVPSIGVSVCSSFRSARTASRRW